MTEIATLPPAAASAARDRLLETATRIFYAEGVNTVGVERIVSEGHVTRATFYRHFPSKQDLVLAYLQTAHDAIEQRIEQLAAAADEPRALLTAIADDIGEQLASPHFRGCAFINTAAEFEDAEHPIRRAVAAHRAWFSSVVRDAFAAAGHPRPGDVARHYVMLRDGAMVGGCLGDPAAARQSFRHAIDDLLRSTGEPRPVS